MNIGTLTIDMIANVARLERDMKQAGSIVTRHTASIEKSARLATNALGLLGIGFSINGIMNSFNTVIDGLTKLDDASQKTGSSIENLSKIRKITSAFGGDFDSVSTGLDKLAKGMASVDSETNKTNKALDFLKVSARDDLTGALRDPSEVLKDIAKNLQGYSDGAGKTALATDLFGKSGAELLPVLNDMADNFDRVSATSKESALRATAFSDNMGLLKLQVTGAWSEMIQGLLPTLIKITSAMTGSSSSSSFFTNVAVVLSKALEGLAIGGGVVSMVFKTLGNVIGAAGQSLQAILKGNFSDIGLIGRSMTVNIGQAQKDYEAFVKQIVMSNDEAMKSVTALNNKPQADYVTGFEKKKTNAALDEQAKKLQEQEKIFIRLSESAIRYAESIRQDTEEIGLTTVQVRMLNAAREAGNAPLESQRMLIMENAKAWADATEEFKRNEEAAKALQKEQESIAEAARRAAEETARYWENTARDISRSLTDALLRGFESGKSLGQNLIDTIKNMFKTLLLRPVIEESIVRPITEALSGISGGAGGKSLLGGLGSIFSMFGSGSAAAAPSGGGMLASMFGAGSSAGGGSLFASMTGGGGGMMAGLSAAVPVAGAIIAAGSIARSLAGDKKLFGIKGNSLLTTVMPIFGIAAALFGKGPKKFGTPELKGSFSESGFDGVMQTPWSRKVGFFSGAKKKGYQISALEASVEAALDGVVAPTRKIFDSLISSLDESKKSLAGWSFAVHRTYTTAEEQKQLFADVGQSMGVFMIPQLVAVQQENEKLTDTAIRMQKEVAVTNQLLDMTGQTFGKIGSQSLGLRDSLIQLLGGVDTASQSLGAFYQSFYSDSERMDSGVRLLSKELQKLGIDTLPQTKEAYRKLVESQDLSTQSGQEMFASLLQLSPAFSQIADSAERLRKEFQLLGTDSFQNVVDYTRYIRLAANQGIGAEAPIFMPDQGSLSNTATVSIPGIGQSASTATDSNVVLIEEVRQLRAEMQAANIAIAQNTGESARIQRRWDGDGLPATRVI